MGRDWSPTPVSLGVFHESANSLLPCKTSEKSCGGEGTSTPCSETVGDAREIPAVFCAKALERAQMSSVRARPGLAWNFSLSSGRARGGMERSGRGVLPPRCVWHAFPSLAVCARARAFEVPSGWKRRLGGAQAGVYLK